MLAIVPSGFSLSMPGSTGAIPPDPAVALTVPAVAPPVELPAEPGAPLPPAPPIIVELFVPAAPGEAAPPGAAPPGAAPPSPAEGAGADEQAASNAARTPATTKLSKNGLLFGWDNFFL